MKRKVADLTGIALQERLAALIEEGLTFSDCVKAFGDDRDSDPYASMAKTKHAVEGEVEIDDTTVISISEGPHGREEGAYVMGWLWVRNPHDDGKSVYPEEP